MEGSDECRERRGEDGSKDAGGREDSHLEQRLIILLGPSMAPSGEGKGQFAHV